MRGGGERLPMERSGGGSGFSGGGRSSSWSTVAIVLGMVSAFILLCLYFTDLLMSYQTDASTAVGYGIMTAAGTVGIVGLAVDGIVIDIHKRNAEKEKKKKAEVERIMNTTLKKFSDSDVEQIALKYETGRENANTDTKQPD